ncbi:MAG TPA: NAD(P)/FAD-dependent oxidoreductase [Humibacillus xanthopallidus]|nr:NAD(P)/FAD-dependent oxidoreductase [Humibacillus xanthopallidus]
MPGPDAIVIGSGPNGLVAANLLVDAGWDVLVLEAQPRVGGAVASDSALREGWVHDTFSSFYPLAAASPTIAALGLERHGLEWVNAPAVVGHPLGEGRWAVLHRDRNDTAASLDALCPGDGDAWLQLCQWWSRISQPLVGALLTPFPPVRHGSALGMQAVRAGGLDTVRRMLLPARSLGTELFRGEGPRLLIAGNAAHADIPVDSPGSGLMGLLLVMLGQELGFPVPRGGAGKLAEAMAARFEVAGGTVRTSCRVEHVVVENSRAIGVRTADGERITSRRCVIADVPAPALYGGLVDWSDLPDRLRRRMARFEWDPATVKVDWALDGPIPWTGAPARAPGTVHLAPSVEALAVAGAETSAGVVPREGLILLGQMATTDPTRAPAGAEAVWAYTHVPHEVRRTSPASLAGPAIESGRWSAAAAERMADRVQARIEEHAPGFGERVVARRVLGPADLESLNENLVGGALNGGTAALQQQLVFRPVPGLGRAETPIKGLYLGSASAHPGGGVHGACGSNAARAALAHARIASWRRPARLSVSSPEV